MKGVGFDRMRKVLGTGLLTNEEPIHLRHRRMMQPPFHYRKLVDYATMMHQSRATTWPAERKDSASKPTRR